MKQALKRFGAWIATPEVHFDTHYPYGCGWVRHLKFFMKIETMGI